MGEEKLDAVQILESNCWSVVCSSCSHGDDSSVVWLVIGHYMAAPCNRVLGTASEEDGIMGAVVDAMKTTKNSAYDYQCEYTH